MRWKMNNYKVSIGIEIHLELKTKSKMFSGAPCLFDSEVNTCCNEIDIAMPGTLPSVNKEAVKKAIMACNALNLNIDKLLRFDRKNYYYSDLPKGYQITQQSYPIGKNGNLKLEDSNITVGIERIHLEEDTAKQFHLKDHTLIDFNRAGTPLIELVSKPDLSNKEQVREYLESLRRIFVYLDISDAKMEEGSMRCDINISLSKDPNKLGKKVEIKNLNSISNAEKAIEFEIKRQSLLLDDNQLVQQETRRYNEDTKETVLMRRKEGTVDYKYFPEPNIVPILLDDAWINSISDEMPILPSVLKNMFINDYKLDVKEINYLLDNIAFQKYYIDAVDKTYKYSKSIFNYMSSELLSLLNKKSISIEETLIKPIYLKQLIIMIDDNTISNKQSKEVLELMINGDSPIDIVEREGLKQNNDSDLIVKLVDEVLKENEQSIIDYKNGKDRALGFLVGQVMKKSKGQANPSMASKYVKEALDAIE